jgi:hypothetical protein
MLTSATAVATQQQRRNQVSQLVEALHKAVIDSNSFYGQFSYQRDTAGNITEVLVSISDGQESGAPEVGSGVVAIEKKSKVQLLQLTELVGSKQSMGVNYSLWRFVNNTQLLRK